MLKFKCSLTLTLLLSLAGGLAQAQSSHSRYELRWAARHPLAALRVKQHLPHALAVCDSLKKLGQPDRFAGGGKLDAFRHVYTMAYLSQYVSAATLRKLGKAHERGNYIQFTKGGLEEGERPDSLACEMDLRNNELGFELGQAGSRLSDRGLQELVLEAIAQGRAWYLKRNSRAEYVGCEGQALNLVLYRENWYVPKCLVRSNE